MDSEDYKLLEAWKLLESNGLGVEWKKETIVNEVDNIVDDRFKDLLIIEDSSTELYIKLGWMTIATIVEDSGEWFISINNKTLNPLGINSKEEALNAVYEYLKEDDNER